MKKWMFLILCLALLSGCGKQAATATDGPYPLEIEYGDSGVTAMAFEQSWYWQNEDGSTGGGAGQAADPLSVLSDIPFVNQSKAKSLKLLFPVEPDSLTIQYRTNADGYSQTFAAEGSVKSLAVPTDGASYLFEVTAVWEQTEKAVCWGVCTYYFRYLPTDATGEQAGEMSVYRLLQLEPSDLFGVEVFNNPAYAQKTCRTAADKETILRFLQDHLSTDFVQTQIPTVEADYVLRLSVADGTQLTLGYATSGDQAWILLGGVPYAAQAMDLDSLWSSLKAQSVSLAEEPSENYLQISEEFPGGDWGEDFVYGYLRALESEVGYDEMYWFDDSKEANGYRLEQGETALSLPLASDCQFWILEGHYKPYCQVTQDALWQWAETTGWDVLFRLYRKDGQVVAICEQYQP